MTASKKCRPCTGRSKTCVRLTSSWQIARRWSYPAARSAGVIGHGSRCDQRSKKAWTSAGPSASQAACKRGGVGAGEKPIVEALKANAIAAEALLHPLVAVETELDGIGQVGADLQERRPPVAIVDVEVVVVDGDRLAREVKHGRVAPARPFVRFERSHLLLRDADEHDALAGGEARAVRSPRRRPCSRRARTARCRDAAPPQTPDGRDEAIVAGFEQGRRRHGIARDSRGGSSTGRRRSAAWAYRRADTRGRCSGLRATRGDG